MSGHFSARKASAFAMANAQFSFWSEPTNLKRNLRRLRAIVWLVTIGAGFVQTWASRFWIEGDGNNYLDVASAYLCGDWKNIVNAYWSPFLSWLLALCLGVFHSSPYWDSTLLHLLDLVGLLLSLFTFEFFFRAFLRSHIQLPGSEDAEASLSELGWWTLAYSLFLSTSLFVLTVLNTTPDVWVAAFTYLIAGLVVRIAHNRGGWHWFALLGLALACAYLTKAFYFPISFVFLLMAWLSTGNPLKTLKQAFLGLLAFALVAGPWVALLSRAKNRFTFGDVGKVAFARFYDRPWHPFFWQGENGTGTPIHPVRQLLAKPRLFEFATPVGGSYPPSFDSTYWTDGVRVHFHLSALLLTGSVNAARTSPAALTRAPPSAAAIRRNFLPDLDSAARICTRLAYFVLPLTHKDRLAPASPQAILFMGPAADCVFELLHRTG